MTAIRSILVCLALLVAGAAAWAADARIEQAEALRVAGDDEGAARLWQQVLGQGSAQTDARALDAARQGLAGLAFRRGDYEEFAALQQARKVAALDAGDERIATDVEMQMALLQRRRGHLEQARVALTRVIAEFRRLGDRDGEGRALTHQGLVLLNQGQYAEALEALEAAQALQRAGADVEIERTLQYLGLLYHGLHDYEQARRYLEQGLAQARKLPDPMRAAPLLGSLARLANDSEQYEAGLSYARQSQQLAEKFPSTPGMIFSLLERGRALLGLGRLDEARAALEESLRLSRSVRQVRSAADATFVLGRVALRAGDQARALQSFREALSVYESANDTPQTLAAYRLMIEPLRLQGETGEALRLAERALTLQEELGGRDASRRIALQEYRHQVADNERQIELLRQANENQQLRLANQAADRKIGLALIAALTTIALVMAWAFARSRRLGRALDAINRQLKVSHRALLRANAMLAREADELALEASTDALTELANRRHVLEALEDAHALALAENGALAVMIADVDHFKWINDSHGHLVGDRVLQRVARLMQLQLPPAATLGRYGGEEFLLVLPRSRRDEAGKLGERLCRAVAEADEAPAVTISIGIAWQAPDPHSDPAELVDAADKALYRAKNAGRNRVEMA